MEIIEQHTRHSDDGRQYIEFTPHILCAHAYTWSLLAFVKSHGTALDYIPPSCRRESAVNGGNSDGGGYIHMRNDFGTHHTLLFGLPFFSIFFFFFLLSPNRPALSSFVQYFLKDTHTLLAEGGTTEEGIATK
jgi:hypothetical protein